MSLLSIVIMTVLFISETWAFLINRIDTSIEIDNNAEKLIRVNFNVTLYDVHCDFVEVGKLRVIILSMCRTMIVGLIYHSSFVPMLGAGWEWETST